METNLKEEFKTLCKQRNLLYLQDFAINLFSIYDYVTSIWGVTVESMA